MSDTPITDGCEVRFATLFNPEDAMWVSSKKARELERELNTANGELSRLKLAYAKSHEEICQIAGKVLGYPWFKDDQKNFPGATEECGVCVGEHVAETIVAELASKYTEANGRIKKLELELEKAWKMHHKAAGDI
jgi:hypothetical protein